MIALDTSVLARFVLSDDLRQQQQAAQLIADNRCSVSWSVLVELCWVLESVAELPRGEVVAAFTAIRDTATLTVPNVHLLSWILERYARGADFADMVHLATAVTGSTEFATFDRKLSRQAGPSTPIKIATLRRPSARNARGGDE